jgi:hypothetical protein
LPCPCFKKLTIAQTDLAAPPTSGHSRESSRLILGDTQMIRECCDVDCKVTMPAWRESPHLWISQNFDHQIQTRYRPFCRSPPSDYARRVRLS